MDSDHWKIQPTEPPKFVYRVEYGFSCLRHQAFSTFAEALAFYRGYTAATSNCDHHWHEDGPRLVNIDNIDGAEDASAAAQHGLTAEQWERVQEVG